MLFDPKTNKSNPDAAGIEAMVRAVNQAPDADFVRAVSPYIDLKQFVNYLGTEKFLSDYDGFLGRVFGMNNLYFYRPPDRGPGIFLPWDKDGAFDWEGEEIFSAVNENVLARRALQVPELRQTYLAALAKAAALAGGPGGWFEQEVDRLYSLIRDLAHADPHKQCAQDGVLVACGAGEFELGVEKVRRFVSARAAVVSGEVTAAGYRPANGSPRLLEGGVVNAAATESPLVAAGSLASLFGERLPRTTAQASGSSLPNALADVVVAVNGARAPLMFVSPHQVNAQIPWALTPGPAAITVFVDGEPGNTVLVTVADFAAGIFLAVHGEDCEPVTAARPVVPGQTLLVYATGLGPAAGASGNWDTWAKPAVSVGDQPAEVETSQLVPGAAGLYQVRIRVPGGVEPGATVPLVLTIGGTKAEISVAVGEASSVH